MQSYCQSQALTQHAKVDFAASLFLEGRRLKRTFLTHPASLTNSVGASDSAFDKYTTSLSTLVFQGTNSSMLFSHQMGYLRPNISPRKGVDAQGLESTY